MQRKRLGCRGDHCHSYAYIRMLAQAEGADRENLPVWLPEDLKPGVRQCIRDDADLDVNGLIFDQPYQVLHFFASMRSSFTKPAVGQIEAPGEAVLQQSTDF